MTEEQTVTPIKQRSVLGKGLSALLSEHNRKFVPFDSDAVDPKRVVSLPVDQLEPGAMQPRKIFNEETLEELTESIKAHGVLQPIIVRKLATDQYEIIAGERRWRSSKRAGLTTVPVLVVTLSDKQAIEYALIENIQRQDLSVIEEAECYKRLVDEFQYSQELLAKQLGKSRSHITNLLRLNQLPDAIKQQVNDKQLTMGHARALLTSKDPITLANRVVEEQLNVRETEALAQNAKGKTVKSRTRKTSSSKLSTEPVDPEVAMIAEHIGLRLGIPVSINQTTNSTGELVLSYRNLAELDRIIQSL